MFLKPAEVVPFSKFSEIRRVNSLRTFSGLENLIMLRLHHANLWDLAWEMFNGLDNLQVSRRVFGIESLWGAGYSWPVNDV